MEEIQKKFAITVSDEDIFSRKGNLGEPSKLLFYLKNMFKNIELKDLNVLDIGAGVGVFSFYISLMGARKVTSLEPELEGGSETMNEKFNSIKKKLGINNVELSKRTFQELDEHSGPFDLIIMHNSINHLDEDSCIRLQSDKSAMHVYMNLFAKLRKLTNKKGLVIIADCSRYNFFNAIGMKNPFAPTIRWNNHQSPYLWRKMLEEIGYEYLSLQWTSLSKLGKIGTIIMSNPITSYFFISHFTLVMKKSV